jgi:putative endonuclease
MRATGRVRNRKRRRAERSGRRSEWLAAVLLALKGYRILERRYRCSSGEIDLVARRGDLLVFAEVKRRATLDSAAGAVTANSRRRIERAADMFLAQRPHLADCSMRYDIVAVAGWRVRHVRGAWRFGE